MIPYQVWWEWDSPGGGEGGGGWREGGGGWREGVMVFDSKQRSFVFSCPSILPLYTCVLIPHSFAYNTHTHINATLTHTHNSLIYAHNTCTQYYANTYTRSYTHFAHIMHYTQVMSRQFCLHWGYLTRLISLCGMESTLEESLC